MCCLNGCQGPQAWGRVDSDPISHPDSIHQPGWRVWEKREDAEEKAKRNRKRGCFCDWRDNSLCATPSWGYKGHQCQANKGQRHLCALRVCACAHTHTHIHVLRLPTEKTQEQENDSGELPVLEEDGKSKSRNKQCSCVNVYMHPHRHAQ